MSLTIRTTRPNNTFSQLDFLVMALRTTVAEPEVIVAAP
jgi:hypothetical protein